MVREVWPYLAAGLLLTLSLAGFGPAWAAALAAVATAVVAAFFRDPHRDVPADSRLLLSPADGRIVGVAADPEGFPPGTRRLSIFLSLFNVHVNRSPADGSVAAVRYSPGAFLPAYRDKASERNEQNLIVLQTPRGPLALKQIAGVVARRIRCWKSTGDPVVQGERIGFIAFGSRVDLYLPPGVELRARVGDRVRGGTSVVAVYPGSEGPP